MKTNCNFFALDFNIVAPEGAAVGRTPYCKHRDKIKDALLWILDRFVRKQSKTNTRERGGAFWAHCWDRSSPWRRPGRPAPIVGKVTIWREIQRDGTDVVVESSSQRTAAGSRGARALCSGEREAIGHKARNHVIALAAVREGQS